jgi:outer membrane protein
MLQLRRGPFRTADHFADLSRVLVGHSYKGPMIRSSHKGSFIDGWLARGGLCAALLPVFIGAPNALAQNAAPPSSEKPWYPPRLERYERELAQGGARGKPGTTKVAIDPRKLYDLPELIDLAERNNPETRIAWERARQAAAAVGLSESFYYPYLMASAGVGYESAFLPFPTLAVDLRPIAQQLARNPQASLQSLETQKQSLPNVSIVGGGTLATDAVASSAALSVKWLLLDFGGRRSVVDGAKERLMMANVGFNAAHQKIVFDVTQKFYALGNVRQKVIVAKSAFHAAQTVEQAVKARLDRGLALKPELLQAQQQSAQFEFDLEAAIGEESDAQVALVETIGILPTTRLQVADFKDKPLPAEPERSVDALIDLALSQRPDLVAKLANLHAREAGVRNARAEYYPKIALDAHVGEARLDVSIDNSPYFGGERTTYGVGLTVEVPIFDGFARREKLRIAESELRSAESELAEARDAVVREVWKAHTDFKTALRKQVAAAKLLTAAENAYDAVFDSYQNGLSTYVEVVNAQRNVTSALSVGHDTRSAIFTSAAALALSIGDLAKPRPQPAPVRRK